MVASLLSPDLFVGLGFGLILGLLIGPVVRSLLIWREYTSASREANLVADVLDRMEVAPWPHREPEGKVPNGKAPNGKAADGKAADGKAADGKAANAVGLGATRRDVP